MSTTQHLCLRSSPLEAAPEMYRNITAGHVQFDTLPCDLPRYFVFSLPNTNGARYLDTLKKI